MNYKPTQVYLDPEDHARLKAEAQRRGISLASLIRELASATAAERAQRYDAKSWDAIIGIDESEEPTDIRNEIETYRAEMADAIYEKKMGLSRPKRRKKT